jgi:hypothetical protein
VKEVPAPVVADPLASPPPSAPLRSATSDALDVDDARTFSAYLPLQLARFSIAHDDASFACTAVDDAKNARGAFERLAPLAR